MKSWMPATMMVLVAVSALSGWSRAQQAPEGESSLKVTEFGVGGAVENRELKDRRTEFAEGERVYFWTRVEGGRPGDRIVHHWFREGREVVSVGLAVGGPHWRTYSYKTLHPGSAGSWRVEARDPEGRVLAKAEFVCRPAEDGSPKPAPGAGAD